MDLAGARARFERSFGGEIVSELVRIEVIDRSLALASKLFVAVIPLSIILRAVTPGRESFGDDLVMRLGLSGVGANATRTLFATGGEVRGAVSVIGVVIVLYSVLSFTRALQRVYLEVWRLRPQLPDALLRQVTWIVGFIAYTVVLAPVRDFEHRHDVALPVRPERDRAQGRVLAVDAATSCSARGLPGVACSRRACSRRSASLSSRLERLSSCPRSSRGTPSATD